jgi:tetratricopeptide (TPR) repeat protein
MIGVPVLYTSLSAPAAGFATVEGVPVIKEYQPPLEVSALPRAEGAFQGRIEELLALGEALTGDRRPRIITIHGWGGQGKTVLAREAVERFAWAWPGGVYAAPLESLPRRELLVTDLARFLGLISGAAEPSLDPGQLEKQVLAQLAQRRVLIVLDNAESLVDAVEAEDGAAIQLADFLRQLPGPTVSLLVTSRVQMQWPGEASLELGGLSSEDGAILFRQSAPQRPEAIEMPLAQQLSQKVEGHPLSLRLLGGAFNASAVALAVFLAEHEEQLVKAENKYVGPAHRHRTLYASMETSVRYLSAELRELLSKLWMFHAPFLPQSAAAIIDPQTDQAQEKHSPVYDRLHTLWQRGLLTRETLTTSDGSLLFYRLHPTMRPYVEQYLAQQEERETLLNRFGAEYARLVRFLHEELDRGGMAASLALLLGEDLERGCGYVTGLEQGYYLLRWGWIQQRLGVRRHGLELTEQALDIAQMQQDTPLYLQVLNNMALVYDATGQPKRALELYEQALPLMRAVGDRAGEATTLNNMAGVYQAIGQPKRALELYERALPLMRAVGDRAGEAATLNNMAGVYQATGQPNRALELYEQALPLTRAVGDRAGEAATLNNMAEVYRATGQPNRALELYEQALPLTRAVGNRAGEAATLNNMALVYQATGQPQRALELFEQALPLMRAVGDRAGESTTRSNIAMLLYRHFNRQQEAITSMERAIAILVEAGLPQDAAGQKVDDLRSVLQIMRTGKPLGGQGGSSSTMPADQIQQIVSNTVAVMTTMPGRRAQWREVVEKALQDAQQRGADLQIEADFFTAVLAILDGEASALPADHPYAQAVVAIQSGIAAGGPPSIGVSEEIVQAVRAFVNAEDWDASRQVVEAKQALLFEPEVEALFEQNIERAKADGDERAVRLLEQHLAVLRACKQRGIAQTFEQLAATQEEALPFDAELIPRSIAALLGGPQEKMAHAQYLATLSASTTDEALKALLNTIQLALFGSDLSPLGQNLSGVYRQAWEAIVARLTEHQ